MPAALPGSTNAENLANPSAGDFVGFDLLSGPKGSPLDVRKITFSAAGVPSYTNDAANQTPSTGGLSTGIGFSSPPIASIPGAGFSDDYIVGVTRADGGLSGDARFMFIGGGKSAALSTAVKGIPFPPAAYIEGYGIGGAGQGGSRDAGAGPAFTGFEMKMVTATGTVANGAAIEAGWINRSGVTLTAGQSAFGSSTSASAAPVEGDPDEGEGPVDTTAPSVSSAVVADASPTVINVTMNEALSGTLAAAARFSAIKNGSAWAISSRASVDSTHFNLTMASALAFGDVATFSYVKGVDPLKDAAGNETPSFGPLGITNNVADLSADPFMTYGTRLAPNFALSTLSANLHFGIHETQFYSGPYAGHNLRFWLSSMTRSAATVEGNIPYPITYYGVALKVGSTWYRVPDIDEDNPLVLTPGVETWGVWTTAIVATVPPHTLCKVQLFFHSGNNDAATQASAMLSGGTRDGDEKRGGSSVASLLPFFADNGSNIAGSSHSGFSGYHGPSACVAQGTDGRPHGILVGMSINGGANSFSNDARLNVGAFTQAFDSDGAGNGICVPMFKMSQASTNATAFTDANTVRVRAMLNAAAAMNGGAYPFTFVFSGHGTNDLTNPTAMMANMRAYYDRLNTYWSLPVYADEALARPVIVDGPQSLAGQTAAGEVGYPAGAKWVVNIATGGPDGESSPTADFVTEGRIVGSMAGWRRLSYDYAGERDKFRISRFADGRTFATHIFVNNAFTVILDGRIGPHDYAMFVNAAETAIDFDTHLDNEVDNLDGTWTYDLSETGVATGTKVVMSLHDQTGLHPGDEGHRELRWEVIEFKHRYGMGDSADVSKPIPVSAQVRDGSRNIIEIQMNEEGLSSRIPATTTFTPSGGKSVDTIQLMGGGIVGLICNSSYSPGDVITVGYTKGATPLRDISGNEVDSFSGFSVTNNIVVTAANAIVITAALPFTTVGETVDLTRAGFGTPVAAVLFFCKSSMSAPTVAESVIGIGMWDGTTQQCMFERSLNGQATTNTRRASDDSIGVLISGSTTSNYTISNITDGIRITFATDFTVVATFVTALLLKDCTAKAFNMVANTTLNAATASPSLGFAPECCLFASIGSALLDQTSGASAALSLGVASNSGAHRMLAFGDLSANVGATLAVQQFSETRCVGEVANDALVWTGEVTTWGADTLTLTTRDGSSGGDRVFGLALGGNISFDLGTLTTPTSTGAAAVTTTVDPEAVVIVLGTAAGTTLETDSDANGVMVGLVDQAGQFSHAACVEDAAATSNTDSVYSATEAINLHTNVATVLTDLVSATVTLGVANFTPTYSIANATARKGWWLAIGPPT